MEGATLGTAIPQETSTPSGAAPLSPAPSSTKRRRKEVASLLSQPRPPAVAACDEQATAAVALGVQRRRVPARLRAAPPAAATKVRATAADTEAPGASPAAAAAETAVAAVADVPLEGVGAVLRGCAVVAAAAVESAAAAEGAVVVGGKRSRGAGAGGGVAPKRRGAAKRVPMQGPAGMDQSESGAGGDGAPARPASAPAVGLAGVEEAAAGQVGPAAVTVAVRRSARAARVQQGGRTGSGGAGVAEGEAVAAEEAVVAVVAVAGAVETVAKAPRRTKAVVQAEVRQDAVCGVFAPHVSLHERYPHSRSYGPGAVALPPPALAVAAAENARLEEAVLRVAVAAAPTDCSDTVDDSAGGGAQDSGSGGGGSGRQQLPLATVAGAGRSGGANGGAAVDEDEQDGEGAAVSEDEAAVEVGSKGRRGGKAGRGGGAAAKPRPKPAPPLPALVHPMPPLIPNLGYACLCATLREHDIFASRDTNKAGFQSKGLEHVSRLALANARDLRPLIEFNEAHGIRFFRLSSGIFPWMSFYTLEELPDAEAIKQALLDAGEAAKRHGHRLTFHPSEFTKIASDKPEVVETSIKELEVHSRIFDLMGFLPATAYNKINIHVGGVYGGKVQTMDRFAKVVLERLSPNCRARLTVENDDRASMFSVQDLTYVAAKARIPIVFDFHHHRFCTGGLSEEAAFRLALGTWPAGVRPVVHWSESQEGRRPHAHSDYISGPINLYGLEKEVDVMIESKAKELALLHYREAAMAGRAAVRPELTGSLAALVADE
ncbi:UV-damage endonuclease [Tetrabaena socialis]|uniref:UV-damage endonuclease n=1 Tax=Tetrabaena socialis TaxID=47790 RepID=A0A2J8AFI9_9CHLO|nr:UV-damage endonuclease [Tetrabaena socialis]|eukprot:PNH11288.1 UV-damage endonuclease [Tetrabaena socialis]